MRKKSYRYEELVPGMAFLRNKHGLDTWFVISASEHNEFTCRIAFAHVFVDVPGKINMYVIERFLDKKHTAFFLDEWFELHEARA